MAFRDDREAALERANSLERELNETKAKLAEAEAQASQRQEDAAEAKATKSAKSSKPRRSSKPREQKEQSTDQRKPRSRWGLVICLLIGLIGGGLIILFALDTQSELSDGALTKAVDTYQSKGQHRRPIIEIAGKRYKCKGGGDWGTRVEIGAAVRYDQRDPANCRYAADVGRMTGSQYFSIGLGVAVMLFFIFLGVRR